MADRDLSRVERLARRICKTVKRGATVESAQLHNLIAMYRLVGARRAVE
jgi:hypothetical protein